MTDHTSDAWRDRMMLPPFPPLGETPEAMRARFIAEGWCLTCEHKNEHTPGCPEQFAIPQPDEETRP